MRTGPAARPACAPALQVFRCVGAWMCEHTPGKRASLVRTAAAPPFRLPCPPPRPSSHQFRTVGKKFAPNCPTDPTNFGLVFRSPQTLGVCGELMSNISATRGHPGMRICMCGSPRGDLSHIAGLTNGRSRSDFSGVEMESLQFVGCSWFMGLIGLVFRFTQNKFTETDYVRSHASPLSLLAHT